MWTLPDKIKGHPESCAGMIGCGIMRVMERHEDGRLAQVVLRISGTGADAPTLSGGVPLALFGRFVSALPDLIAGRDPHAGVHRLPDARIRVEEGSVKFVVLVQLLTLGLLLDGGLRDDISRLSSGLVPLDLGRRAAVSEIQRGLAEVEGGVFEVSALDGAGVVLAQSTPVGAKPLVDDTSDLFVEEEATLVGTAYDIGVQATREAVEHSTRPYERLRLLVRYRRNLRTGECKGYTLVRIIKAFDFETFRERLHAAIERESRAWAGIDHAAWLQEMREG